MCRCSTLALAAAFAVQLGRQASEGFGLSPLTPALKRCPVTGSRERASRPQVLVCSATTATGPEEKTEPRRRLLRRGQASSPRSTRRVTVRAIQRRAKRLHRIRKKQQALGTTVDEVNDVGLEIESQHTTYYDASSPATSEKRPPAAGEGQKEARLAMAATMWTGETEESIPAEEPLSALVDEKRVKPSSRRRPATSTVKGRRIAKAGEGRGLWRSIFGPKSLLEVHSAEELSRLVDVEGWALEDLSVLTPNGTRPADHASVGHPAVRAVLERAARGTTPSEHGDGRRIGLAIEVRPTSSSVHTANLAQGGGGAMTAGTIM